MITVTRVDYLYNSYINLVVVTPGLYVADCVYGYPCLLSYDGDIPEVYYLDNVHGIHNKIIPEAYLRRKGKTYRFTTEGDTTYMHDQYSGVGYAIDVNLPNYSWGHSMAQTANDIIVMFARAVVYITFVD